MALVNRSDRICRAWIGVIGARLYVFFRIGVEVFFFLFERCLGSIWRCGNGIGVGIQNTSSTRL